MIGENDLAVLLNHRDAIAALQGYYVRIWERVLRALAVGIARPGSLRVRQLLAELRYLIALLNPSGDTYVRRWVQAWARQGMELGQKTAVDQIKAQVGPSSGAAGDFGQVVEGKNLAAATSLASITGTATERLRGLNAQMLLALSLAVRRTQFVLTHNPTLQDGTVGGILRTNAGRDVAGDISDAILRGAGRRLAARLGKAGIPQDLINTFDRINRGQVLGGTAPAINLEGRVGEIGSGVISDANNSGAQITAQANSIDHVRITNPTRVGKPDVCTVFAGHVFFIGAGGKDPLGFPALRDVPNGGPKFHPNCRHGIQPYVLRLKKPQEISASLAAAQAIPKEYFNVKPYDVTKKVRKMDPTAVNPIARPPRKKENVA